MSAFNILAGIASIISLIFALMINHKHQIMKAKETGNIALYQERLKNINTILKSSATILQTLIRRCDNKDVEIIELQNIGRAVRSNIYAALIDTDALTKSLEEWNFGELLKTGNFPQDDNNIDRRGR